MPKRVNGLFAVGAALLAGVLVGCTSVSSWQITATPSRAPDAGTATGYATPIPPTLMGPRTLGSVNWAVQSGESIIGGYLTRAQDHDDRTYIVDTNALHAPLCLNVGRIHGWLDATHYLASIHQAGDTKLYYCVPSETCQPLAQFVGEIQGLSYTKKVCHGDDIGQ